MGVAVKTITSYLEELAPVSAVLPGDSVGLQLGDPDAEVAKIIVALDPDQAAVEEAISIGAALLITHHPFFYHKLSSINESFPEGALIAKAIRNKINIYSAHTNYDIAPQGVTFQLAKTLDLPVENAEVLEVTNYDSLLKLVFFVPVGHEDDIREAISAAGAGHIGNYSHCTFQIRGTGTFMPGERTGPYIGSRGKLEKVDELRLETIIPESRRSEIIRALTSAHPYEEVAYDLYPLDFKGKTAGLGLVLETDKPFSIEQLLQLCRDRLDVNNLRHFSAGKYLFKRIALCGGSGGSLIEHAVRKKADIFISGDFRYHDLKQAEALGLALIDAGHDATEQPGIVYLRQYLEKKLNAGGLETEVCLQTPGGAKWI